MDTTAEAFSPDQEAFATYVHRAIWDKSVHLVPPGISLADMPAERQAAFLDLHRFLQAVYADMYSDPDGYHLDAYGIERLLGRQTWRQAMVSAGWNKQRDKLRKLSGLEIVNLPLMFVSAISRDMALVGDAAVIDRDVFEKDVARIRGKCYPGLPASTPLTVLSRHGIDVASSDGTAVVSNPRYPGMFRALDEWRRLRAEHTKGDSKYKYDSAFTHLDCRAFLASYQITYESVLSSASEEVRGYLSVMGSVLGSLGLRFGEPKRVRSLSCDYRGQHLLYFGYDSTYPIIRTCMFRTGTPAYAEFAKAVEGLPNADEVKAFCLGGLNRCRLCGCHPVPPSRLGYWTEVFGRKVKLCGGRHCFETSDFSRPSREIMETLVRINYRLIRAAPA